MILLPEQSGKDIQANFIYCIFFSIVPMGFHFSLML